MALLEVEGVSKSYPTRAGLWRSRKYVTESVTFSIPRGETLGLVGESGSGKSTIARIILGLIVPDSGSVHFDGQSVTGGSNSDLRKLRRRMQPVFQDPFAALNPRMRIADIVAEPLRIHGSEIGFAGSASGRQANAREHAVRAKTRELIASVGLDESALSRYPHEFSGGQRQRINIARALALRPELLVLDEPVSALDVSVGAQIVNLLRQLQRDHNLTYLFISHSMPLVRYLATNVAVMRRGRIVEQGDTDTICNHARDEYTKTLIAATPELKN